MLACIGIVGLALAWLGYETKWLTIRLTQFDSIEEFDAYILAKMAREAGDTEYFESLAYEAKYQAWLKYEPTYHWGSPKNPPMSIQDRAYANAKRKDLLSRFPHHELLQ